MDERRWNALGAPPPRASTRPRGDRNLTSPRRFLADFVCSCLAFTRPRNEVYSEPGKAGRSCHPAGGVVTLVHVQVLYKTLFFANATRRCSSLSSPNTLPVQKKKKKEWTKPILAPLLETSMQHLTTSSPGERQKNLESARSVQFVSTILINKIVYSKSLNLRPCCPCRIYAF